MAEDEFKTSGSYFDHDRYVSLSITDPGERVTIEGWFIWLAGDGPLMASVDDSWRILYDVGGDAAYRIGGVERVTTVPIATIKDERWTYVAIAKAESEVALRIDGTNVDLWGEAPSPAPIAGMMAMKDAVGFAADVAFYEKRLPNHRLDAHWKAGRRRV